jgi:hypothetical protein
VFCGRNFCQLATLHDGHAPAGWKSSKIRQITSILNPDKKEKSLFNSVRSFQGKNMKTSTYHDNMITLSCMITSVAEPHHFYASPAPSKIFDAAPAKSKKVYIRVRTFLLMVFNDFNYCSYE